MSVGWDDVKTIFAVPCTGGVGSCTWTSRSGRLSSPITSTNTRPTPTNTPRLENSTNLLSRCSSGPLIPRRTDSNPFRGCDPPKFQSTNPDRVWWHASVCFGILCDILKSLFRLNTADSSLPQVQRNFNQTAPRVQGSWIGFLVSR